MQSNKADKNYFNANAQMLTIISIHPNFTQELANKDNTYYLRERKMLWSYNNSRVFKPQQQQQQQ